MDLISGMWGEELAGYPDGDQRQVMSLRGFQWDEYYLISSSMTYTMGLSSLNEFLDIRLKWCN